MDTVFKTKDDIFSLKEIIHKTLQQNNDTYLALLIWRVFDRAPREKIWTVSKEEFTIADGLRQRGVLRIGLDDIINTCRTKTKKYTKDTEI